MKALALIAILGVLLQACSDSDKETQSTVQQPKSRSDLLLMLSEKAETAGATEAKNYTACLSTVPPSDNQAYQECIANLKASGGTDCSIHNPNQTPGKEQETIAAWNACFNENKKFQECKALEQTISSAQTEAFKVCIANADQPGK